jgi:hypothetical protein
MEDFHGAGHSQVFAGPLSCHPPPAEFANRQRLRCAEDINRLIVGKDIKALAGIQISRAGAI